MKGIGIDIVELQRIKKARFLDRAADFVFTDSEKKEMNESGNSLQYFASRFAAKEAVIKAFPEKLTYLDFEIIKLGDKPKVSFKKPEWRDRQILVSLSHSTDYAAGFAIAL